MCKSWGVGASGAHRPEQVVITEPDLHHMRQGGVWAAEGKATVIFGRWPQRYFLFFNLFLRNNYKNFLKCELTALKVEVERGESSFSPSRGSTWTFNMVSQKAKVLELYLLGQYMTLTSLKMNAIMEMSYNGWHPACLCGCYPTLQQYAYFKTSLHWSLELLFGKKSYVYLTVGKIVQRLTLVKNNNCYHLGWTNKWEKENS